MNSKRCTIIPLTVGPVFVLLFRLYGLTPLGAAAVWSAPMKAPQWHLYEPVAEIVVPAGDVNAPRAVEEKDGYVYLLAREGILYTYDISDLPLQPSFTTYNAPVYKQTSYNGNGILRHGNYLYVFGRSGIQTIDVQNPGTPSLLGLRSDLNIYNMVRHESYLIAAGRKRIAVYSIDEPSNPTLLSDLDMGEEQLVWSAAVYGSTLYACNWTSDWEGSYTNWLSMIDFSNPASLSVLNTISLDDQAYHLRVVGNQLIECTSSQVGLWDLTTPANPVLLTSQRAGGRVCALDGDNIVTNGTVLRTDGNDLEIVATFTAGDSQRDGFPYGSAVNASFVFIAQHKRILVLNAGPPALSINYASGGPGSFFTIAGHGFPRDSTATIVVNSHTLGDLSTDSAGGCLFLLSTEQADEGRYVVTATANRSASTSLVIASGEPVHPQEGSGTIFQIPSGIAYGKYGGGNGMPEDPYQIWRAEHLNAAGAEPSDWDKHFKLMADVDLSGYSYEAALIAPDLDPCDLAFVGTSFAGVFDGNGHAISNMTIHGGGYLGLFGRTESAAVVENLGLPDANIAGTDYVGGLVGFNRGRIATSYVTGTISGNKRVGGLTGRNWGSIAASCNMAGVTGSDDVGGLAAANYGSITNSYNAGPLTASWDVGGLVGENYGSIAASYSTGTVSGQTRAGGLVGYTYPDYGTVTDCFWDTETSGQATSDGGIGKATAEMQMAGTFLNAGWDFVDETANGTDDIWWILEGQDYPRLWWEPMPQN